MIYEKNEEFETEITDISDDGSGIGRTEGFTWFIKDTVPGDKVRAACTKLKKSYGYARVVEVLTPSADRRDPKCPKARACGGCQLQQMSYAAQLKFKENRVLNALKRIGGFDIDRTEPIIGMEEPFRYRNKAIYPIGRSKDGRIIAGFFAGRTHSIIECEDCLLGYEENKDILKAVISFMEEEHIEPYDETAHCGMVRHVMIRKGHNTGEIMVCLVINADRIKASDRLCKRLLKAAPGIRTIDICINKNRTNVIMDGLVVNLYGDGYIEDSVGGVRFKISPRSFFQVNSVQMERLYGTALEFTGLTGTENVWDLYCGVGTISLFLAGKAKRVLGVEIVPEAIEDARENAGINGIDNAEFYVGRAEEVLPRWYEEHKGKPDGHVDVIVVDPPRKGCDIKCLETIVSIAPEKVVYVSCDPATLARDLKFLCSNGYELKRVRPCDMFPQTVHVETVVLLSHKSPDSVINVKVEF